MAGVATKKSSSQNNYSIIGDDMLLFISVLLIYGLKLHWSLYFVAAIIALIRAMYIVLENLK